MDLKIDTEKCRFSQPGRLLSLARGASNKWAAGAKVTISSTIRSRLNTMRNLISTKLIDEFATNGNDVCPSPTKYISDRRAHVRRRTGSPAYIEPGEGNRALVLSISESGLALRADRPVTEDPTLRMRFLLPESKSWVQTNGRIAWVSESRKEAA